jgi:hypothetical protein
MAQEKQQSGISLQTLLISSLAAVAAAIVVPLFWERGTLIATAMTPVIVAVVSEALRKPVEVIKSVTPAPTRRSATGAAVRDPGFDPLPPDARAEPPAVRDDDPFGLRAKPRVGHHWRLAIATGAIACVIAVVALTASELVLGGPATRAGGRTTIFRGDSSTPTATPTATPADKDQATPTATPTGTPQTESSPQPTPSATATETPRTQTAPQTTPTPTPTP